MAKPLAAISGVHYESELDLTMEAAEVAEATAREWLKAGGEGLGEGGFDPAPLTALLQRDVRALFRQSISRRPTVWPQVVMVPARG